MARTSTKPKDEATPAVEDEQGAPNPTPSAEEDRGSIDPANEDTPSGAVDAIAPVEGATEGNADSTTEAEPFIGTHVVNTERGLNLRQSPSYGAPVVEILPLGTTVQNIDPDGAPSGWLWVMTEAGKAGYVDTHFVTVVD